VAGKRLYEKRSLQQLRAAPKGIRAKLLFDFINCVAQFFFLFTG
jgi:hypothetical protein